MRKANFPSAEGRARVWRAALAALFCLFAGAPFGARAEASGGRLAYEKGEYARALAEWQKAAKAGDADAEFGLGELYEFGEGGLEQSYRHADRWYRKAARKGKTEAEYRLALIWAAGGANFPPDFAEAYKWALLAAAAKGPWARLARELKRELAAAATPQQRAEGERRALLWKAAGSPPKPKPAATATAKPAAPPPPTPLDQLRKTLAQFDCAALRARAAKGGLTVISGTVPESVERERLFRLAARFFPGRPTEVKVRVVPPPLCRTLVELDALRRAGALAERALELRLAGQGSQLVEGEPIKVELKGPDYATTIRIDYFSLDGEVLHLWPNAAEPVPRLDAGATRLFWDAGGGKTWNAGGAPFGTELITAVASRLPLDLASPAAPVEPAAQYLRRLRRALAGARKRDQNPPLLALLLVRTRAR